MVMTQDRQNHWDSVYGSKAATEVSWYESFPQLSLGLIRAAGLAPEEPIIDVGAGASRLVDELLAVGYRNLTVLDISASVLEQVRDRLGARASSVALVHLDVTAFQPEHAYALWHDRAVFHFLITPGDRARYVSVLERAVRINGQVILATFGPEGPERCSGLQTCRYDAESLAAQLGANFSLVASSLAIHQTPWGASQQFLYCRFQRRPSRTDPAKQS